MWPLGNKRHTFNMAAKLDACGMAAGLQFSLTHFTTSRRKNPSNRLSEFVLGAFVHIAWSTAPSPVDAGIAPNTRPATAIFHLHPRLTAHESKTRKIVAHMMRSRKLYKQPRRQLPASHPRTPTVGTDASGQVACPLYRPLFSETNRR